MLYLKGNDSAHLKLYIINEEKIEELILGKGISENNYGLMFHYG